MNQQFNGNSLKERPKSWMNFYNIWVERSFKTI